MAVGINTNRLAARMAHRLRAIVVEQTIPVKSGELRRSIHVSRRGPGYIVATNKVYARAVHEGRRSITIRPKSRKALKFTKGGKVVYTRKVTLPKTKPQPFFKEALDKFRSNANEELSRIAPEISQDARDILAYQLKNIPGLKIK